MTNDKKDEKFWIISMSLLLTAIIVALISGYMIGESSESKRLKTEAVRNGVARWILDNNGRVEFEWFECK
jgi:hypothetical protein